MHSTQCIHVCIRCVCVYTYSIHVVHICSSIYIHIHVYIYIYTYSIYMQYGVYTVYTRWNIVYMEYTYTDTHWNITQP